MKDLSRRRFLGAGVGAFAAVGVASAIKSDILDEFSGAYDAGDPDYLDLVARDDWISGELAVVDDLAVDHVEDVDGPVLPANRVQIATWAPDAAGSTTKAVDASSGVRRNHWIRVPSRPCRWTRWRTAWSSAGSPTTPEPRTTGTCSPPTTSSDRGDDRLAGCSLATLPSKRRCPGSPGRSSPAARQL